MAGRFCARCGADVILATTWAGKEIELDATVRVWCQEPDMDSHPRRRLWGSIDQPEFRVAHSDVCRGVAKGKATG